MNIFLVEDTIAVRRLIVRRLEGMPGLRVVGEAGGEADALALIRWTQPDVVLLDLALASGSGLGLLRQLRATGFTGRVAVLTSEPFSALHEASLLAGADAFYDKANGLETLFDDLGRSLDASEVTPDEPAPKSSLRDGLTGLYDDVALLERLDQSARQAGRDGSELAVYVLRLVGLQAMGALADPLVPQAAAALRGICADADIVARRAADQFSVVLTRIDHADQAAAFARRLIELMLRLIPERGLALHLGMALFPGDAVSPRGLLTLAEASAFGAL
jgi:DNA-binding NarL/FixJ family response regulator